MAAFDGRSPFHVLPGVVVQITSINKEVADLVNACDLDDPASVAYTLAAIEPLDAKIAQLQADQLQHEHAAASAAGARACAGGEGV